MTYKFVTREELDAATELSTGGAAIKFQFLAYRLLAERDAHREFMKTLPLPIEVADMEVARIMEGKK